MERDCGRAPTYVKQFKAFPTPAELSYLLKKSCCRKTWYNISAYKWHPSLWILLFHSTRLMHSLYYIAAHLRIWSMHYVEYSLSLISKHFAKIMIFSDLTNFNSVIPFFQPCFYSVIPFFQPYFYSVIPFFIE